MLSRAVEFHKLYILCLLSLGLIHASMPYDHDLTNEEFDRDILPYMELHIPIKSPGSTKVLKKLGMFNKYWEESVVSKVHESIQMNPLRKNTTSLVQLVFNFYKENMHLGKYYLDEFPRISPLASSSSQKPPPPPHKVVRASKRKKEIEGTSQQEIQSLEENMEEEMEVPEYEEILRPSKRLRKPEELIEVHVDQVGVLNCCVVMLVGSICIMECIINIF